MVGDRIIGIRHGGDGPFIAVDGWRALKAFYLANRGEPGHFDLRIERDGKTYWVEGKQP